MRNSNEERLTRSATVLVLRLRKTFSVEKSDRIPRKLAAILYADVAGYARLTGEDEDATHRTLSEYLDLISGSVESHQQLGRLRLLAAGGELVPSFYS